MKEKGRIWRSLAIAVAMLAMLGVSASAEEPEGFREFTVHTTMREIYEDPIVVSSGFYASYRGERDCALRRAFWENWEVQDYIGVPSAQESVDALNLLRQNYRSGIQVTHKLYTEEEITEVPARANAELYYFPAPEGSDKRNYALVVGGNVGVYSGELGEGLSTAWELHQMGYPVFVLRYRIWTDAADNAPLEDLARAISYITEHSREFDVQAEDYGLVSYSSGGQLAGLFGTETYGYAQFGLPKPGALLMAYPVIDFSAAKLLYCCVIDKGECGWRYYWTNVGQQVTEEYPPVYHWIGKNDLVLPLLGRDRQSPGLEQALQQQGVLHLYEEFEDAPHAVGTGVGTDAEGWLEQAAAFWESIVEGSRGAINSLWELLNGKPQTEGTFFLLIQF